ncbi:xanthine dehydrogenase family protein molybdopterin-binding subunit [Amycolatopsis sp. lyj-109]|uniref:xanthine dehydrogenase family protein molybdopterin-binding subunit n=1 Tax=Amycolatopsis sp. lyj-109 TaxID=2789287 RepID=UPI00397894CC
MTGNSVGTPTSRVDGRLKVTGGATYAAEHAIPGVVYGVIVNSTVGRGVITAIDTGKAEALSGVLRVLTDFSGVQLGFDTSRVNFFGQAVAVVVATSLEQAEHGASLVAVSYAPQPVLIDMESPETVPKPAPRSAPYSRGDADGALRTAHAVVDNTFTIEREHHNPMELASTIARWDGGKLTLWDKTQWVQGTARFVATSLGIDAADVRVLSPFVGGAFGNAAFTWEHQYLAAFAARELRRPVKIVLTRKQMYTGVGYRPASRQRLAIGAGADGRISAIVQEVRSETARYTDWAEAITTLAQFMYGGPNVRTRYDIVPVDLSAPTAMRGPGQVTGAFALESSMDQLAHELGVDPIELRLRNEPATDQALNLPFSSRRLADCYRAGAQRFGWQHRNPVPRSRKEGNLLIGTGMAAAGYHAHGSATNVLARINDDGTAEVFTATSDCGPGTYTSVTQVAADALGLPLERVRFALGDSSFPLAPYQAGSMTMVSVGSAMFNACNALRDSFVRTAVVDPASPLHGLRPEDVSARNGRLVATADPARGETYQQILRRRGRRSMDTTQGWEPGDAPTRFSSYSYGAVFAEVSVDESLGLVRIRRLFGAYDGGRVVNPKLAHSQALGGMVAGIGMALLEGTTVDHRDGRVMNANLADYLVPVNADVPELDAMFVTSEDTELDPIGVKGLGEVVIVGVPAAIANAVFNATGRRVTSLPITLDKLM